MIVHRHRRALRLGLTSLALSTVLAACGGGGGDEEAAQDTSAAQGSTGTQNTSAQNSTTDTQPAADSAASAEFNDADVTYVQTMIPHHEQALTMAGLAKKNASREEVKKLAADIEAAQRAEMEQMRGWLKEWNKPESAMTGMDHGPGGMKGMTSDADMAAMEKATGAEFEKLFLKSMIEHHRGAIDAAKAEQANGKNADAKASADAVVTDQSAEIERIQKLLDAM